MIEDTVFVEKNWISNRLYLVHRPTGFGALLGMVLVGCQGWWTGISGVNHVNYKVNVQRLFDLACKNDPKSSDFFLVMEDASGAPGAEEAAPVEVTDTKGNQRVWFWDVGMDSLKKKGD